MTCLCRAVRNVKIRTDDAFDGHSVAVFSKVGAHTWHRESPDGRGHVAPVLVVETSKRFLVDTVTC